jgi:hypothetical protein
MTLLWLLCLNAHEYDKIRVEVGLTQVAEHYERALAVYEKARKERALKEGDMRPTNLDKVFTGPTLIVWYDSDFDSDFDFDFDSGSDCDSDTCCSLVQFQWFRSGKNQSATTPY